MMTTVYERLTGRRPNDRIAVVETDGDAWGTTAVFADVPTDLRPGQEQAIPITDYEALCAQRGEQPRYHPNTR